MPIPTARVTVPTEVQSSADRYQQYVQLRRMYTSVFVVGSAQEARGRERSTAAPRCRCGRLRTPIAASGQSTNITGSGAPETSGDCQKMATGGVRWTVSPRTTGRRIASPFPPTVGRRWTIGRRRGWMGAKRPR